jgi:phage shock protein E
VETLLLTGLLLLVATALATFRAPEAAKPSRLRDVLEDGALLLDVRSVFEYHAGHAPGAVNLPLDELEDRLPELGPPGRPIVVYCASGARSREAASTLRAQGFVVLDAGTLAAVTRDASG